MYMMNACSAPSVFTSPKKGKSTARHAPPVRQLMMLEMVQPIRQCVSLAQLAKQRLIALIAVLVLRGNFRSRSTVPYAPPVNLVFSLQSKHQRAARNALREHFRTKPNLAPLLTCSHLITMTHVIIRRMAQQVPHIAIYVFRVTFRRAAPLPARPAHWERLRPTLEQPRS